MCGIAGMLGLEADPETLRKMLAGMGRRGPDSSGIFRDEDAAYGVVASE